MVLKKVFKAFSAFTLMSAAEAASISAESKAQAAATVVVPKPSGAFTLNQAGVFCRSDSGVANDQVVMLSPDLSFQGPCDGRTTFWSPKGRTGESSETFNMTLMNYASRSVNVYVHGGVRGSSNGWPALKGFTISAKRVCSIQYSPSISFSVPRGRDPGNFRILWDAPEPASLVLRPSASVAGGGVLTKDGDSIVYNIKKDSDSKPDWRQSDRSWHGSALGNFYLFFGSTEVPAGDYTGSIQVTLNCF